MSKSLVYLNDMPDTLSHTLYHNFLLSHYHAPQNYGLLKDFDVEQKGLNSV